MLATVRAALTSTVDRLVHAAAGERPLLEPAIASCTAGACHVRRLDDDVRRDLRRRGSLPACGRTSARRRVTAGAPRRPGCAVCSCERRQRRARSASRRRSDRREERAGAGRGRRSRPRCGSRRRRGWSRRRNGTRTSVDAGRRASRAAPGSTVSEPSTRPRRRGSSPRRTSANVASPVRNMPAIATITVRPEIEHRAARGGGGGLERRPFAPPRRALLALALQVEHRVVDADREPDQEHDRAGPASSTGSTLARAARPGRTSRTRP